MISVLLPTRQRASMAARSLESLGDNIEPLLWVDDDDPELEEYKKLPYKVFVKPRVGYHGMYEMINFLAKKAKGDWLLLWNDDTVMNTPNWQDKLPKLSQKPIVLNIFNSNPEMNLFPLINRAMYDTMGHFSLSAHCDSWVQDIANRIDIHEYVPGISIDHLRDIINDETKQHSQSAYATTSPLHSSDRMLALMQVDIDKIRKLL